MARSYSHRGKHRHRQATKRHWYAYFISNDGRFGRKRINPILVALYKARIKKHIELTCVDCGSFFHWFYRNDKEFKQAACPFCASQILEEESNESVS